MPNIIHIELFQNVLYLLKKKLINIQALHGDANVSAYQL